MKGGSFYGFYCGLRRGEAAFDLDLEGSVRFAHTGKRKRIPNVKAQWKKGPGDMQGRVKPCGREEGDGGRQRKGSLVWALGVGRLLSCRAQGQRGHSSEQQG